MYLDGELAKSKRYEALNKSIKGLTDKEHFHQLKDKGVGQTTILKFLGGNWKEWVLWHRPTGVRPSQAKLQNRDRQKMLKMPDSKKK